MTEITGFAAMEQGGALQEWKYIAKKVGDNDVRLKIECCGICHSDVHQVDNGWGGSSFPMIPGHEVIGVVVEKGKNASLEIGTRVGVGPQAGACFDCDMCKAGDESYCPKAIFSYNSKDYEGNPTYGGYADGIVVDYRFAFPIPENLNSIDCAPLLCAGLTVYAPFDDFGIKGKRVGVVGVGGLGHLALQFANKMGAAEVVAISSTENKKELAMQLGATKFIASKERDQMKAAASSIDFLLSCAAFDLDWDGLLGLLAPKGVLHLVGAPESKFSVSFFRVLGGKKSISGSMIGSIKQTKDMLQFAADHDVKAMISEVAPMKEANKHLQTCREGKARFRIVLKN